MTERQKTFFIALSRFILSHRKAPTYSEMLGMMKVTSKQAIADLLSALQRKGLVQVYSGKKRGIAITNKGVSFLVEEGIFVGMDVFRPYLISKLQGEFTDATASVDTPGREAGGNLDIFILKRQDSQGTAKSEADVLVFSSDKPSSLTINGKNINVFNIAQINAEKGLEFNYKEKEAKSLLGRAWEKFVSITKTLFKGGWNVVSN